ncbi:uncharacterized protein TNCV_2873811 [Trichonephila clavipes]|nr:uncharacterized protein TNCV_2873811 [Trichonephila clavipes]
MIFLRGRIIERLECGRNQLEVSEELGIAQSVISRPLQRFQDDGNVSRCYSTGGPRVTTPKEDRYIWQLLPKETDGAQYPTCLVRSLQLPVRQFQGLVCSLILTGHYNGERQVPVTNKRTPLNDTVMVVQDGSFGEELFLVPELTCMFRM